jgi:hypothetical protein
MNAAREFCAHMSAKLGVKLAYDALPLAEVFGGKRRPQPKPRKLAKDATTMTKTQQRARDFAQLATIHARDGETVSRTIIEGLPREARDELYALSHALTSALRAGPEAADPDVASDAIPGLRRIIGG